MGEYIFDFFYLGRHHPCVTDVAAVAHGDGPKAVELCNAREACVGNVVAAAHVQGGQLAQTKQAGKAGVRNLAAALRTQWALQGRISRAVMRIARLPVASQAQTIINIIAVCVVRAPETKKTHCQPPMQGTVARYGCKVRLQGTVTQWHQP